MIKILSLLFMLDLALAPCHAADLMTSVLFGNLEEVNEHLTTSGTDLDLIHHDQGTLLMVAALMNHVPVVKALLGARADVNKLDRKQQSVLRVLAAAKDRQEVIDILLAVPGINVDQADELGTPLIIASVDGLLDTVKSLLNAKADVHHVNMKRRETALMVAGRRDHRQVVQALLDYDENHHFLLFEISELQNALLEWSEEGISQRVAAEISCEEKISKAAVPAPVLGKKELPCSSELILQRIVIKKIMEAKRTEALRSLSNCSRCIPAPIIALVIGYFNGR